MNNRVIQKSINLSLPFAVYETPRTKRKTRYGTIGSKSQLYKINHKWRGV